MIQSRRPPTGPTVSAGYARALLEFAVSNGAPRAALYTGAGIRADDLQDQDNRVSLDCFIALMRASKELCNMPSLALHFGASTELHEMSIVGLIALASANVAEALVQLNRFGGLVAELDGVASRERFRLERVGGELWLEDTRADPNAFPELTESTWARFIGEFSRRFPDTHWVEEIHVTHPAPDYRDAYDELLGAPVVFGSGRNAMRIDESWLAVEINPKGRYVFGVLSDHAEKLLQSLQSARSTCGQVENLLIPLLHKGDVSMPSVAKKMGLSRTTLYRRLKAEGLSFEKVLDELRHRMALHYLNSKKVSVNETAYLVGFSEPSAFSRAFKRWTGHRPGRSPTPRGSP